jgi:hypothetical protein
MTVAIPPLPLCGRIGTKRVAFTFTFTFTVTMFVISDVINIYKRNCRHGISEINAASFSASPRNAAGFKTKWANQVRHVDLHCTDFTETLHVFRTSM